MATNIQEQAVQTFEIVKQEEIAAPMGLCSRRFLSRWGH